MAAILRGSMVGSGISLVLNAGSSSVKFRLYVDDHQVLDGVVDHIGNEAVLLFSKNGVEHKDARPICTHGEAGVVIHELVRAQGVPQRIIHRIVHGGDRDAPALITPELLHELKELVPLSPLHLPPSIALIEFFMQHTSARHIACFDTMFHQTMPQQARLYAIPIDLARQHRIRRYGFHGLAHQAMLEQAQRLSGRRFARVITCQLGNGASLCAIKDGKSVDTSMGLTPLEGLVMGTRSGDIDPAALVYLAHQARLTPERVLEIFERESGLKGLAGESDVRKLLEREKRGDAVAVLALDIFAHRVRKYLGAYLVGLGGVDLIVLSGGIARAPAMRKRILSGLENFGIVLADAASLPARIGKGPVEVWVLEVDEQDLMFRLSQF